MHDRQRKTRSSNLDYSRLPRQVSPRTRSNAYLLVDTLWFSTPSARISYRNCRSRRHLKQVVKHPSKSYPCVHNECSKETTGSFPPYRASYRMAGCTPCARCLKLLQIFPEAVLSSRSLQVCYCCRSRDRTR